ncbi:hypothetical protein, partial [Georgenia sp. 311]|uniref:hypothetical protein n=1 Tax=Georgenia sp. 311 TaxID=2585134 RepID=UPI001C3F3498
MIIREIARIRLAKGGNPEGPTGVRVTIDAPVRRRADASSGPGRVLPRDASVDGDCVIDADLRRTHVTYPTYGVAGRGRDRG